MKKTRMSDTPSRQMVPSKPTILNATDPVAFDQTLAVLRGGDLVALPTETVYGLAANATDPHAVARIFAAKGRPSFNPLIAHVANLEHAMRYGVFDERAMQLARNFWPGSLTLVVPSIPGSDITDLARAGLDTVALRCPQNTFTRSIIEALDMPLAAPSANRSGRLSPTRAAHVATDFNADQLQFIVNDGACTVGVESTIVGVLPGQPLAILRVGLVDEAQLAQCLPNDEVLITTPDTQLHDCDAKQPIAPGMLLSHYAPSTPLLLADSSSVVQTGDAVLTFADQTLPGTQPFAVRDLSPKADLIEAAANLFSMLHELDAQNPRRIIAIVPPTEGIGRAISDRLRRAAAGSNTDDAI